MIIESFTAKNCARAVQVLDENTAFLSGEDYRTIREFLRSAEALLAKAEAEALEEDKLQRAARRGFYGT